MDGNKNSSSSKNPRFIFLKKCADFILDLIFPVECLSCGKNGTWFCGECFSKLNFNPALRCFNCGQKERFGKTCGNCKNENYLNGLWSGSEYKNKTIKKLIKSLKYYLVKDLSAPLGKYLMLFLKNILLEYRNNNKQSEIQTLKKIENALLIPVPLHKTKLRWRGFNQSREMAKILEKEFNLRVNDSDLVKIKRTKPQAKMKKEKRKENIKNSFVWQGENLKNKNIILVDDVSTSGCTLNECAKILKQNGAGEVWGLVVARG